VDDEGAAAGVVHDWITRVLPGPVRYRGRVHEQPQHGLPVQRLAVHIGHDGYTPLRLAAKRGRNRTLLQAELARQPGDAALWFALGKDHAAYDEHRDAAAAFARADALAGGPTAWQADLASRYVFALKKAGQHAQAWAWAEPRLAGLADSPDFFFALGDLMLDWAATQPADAAALLGLAEAAWQRCLEIGERPDQAGSVQGRGSHLAAHNLAVVCEGLGDNARAQVLRLRYPPPAALR
jgi:tetratricopeptide (TPR) repeat protein